MKVLKIDLNKDYSDALKEATAVLESGGIIICPTDTLYGIGCNALNESAVRKIFSIKERPYAKPLPIIVRNIKWAKELAFVSKKNEGILGKIWPGRVTAVLPKKEIVPDILTSGQKTVGIRIPNHPLVDRLLKIFGYPIALTSANISGEEPTQDINKIIEIFSEQPMIKRPDLALDIGILPRSEPSAILDLTGDKPKISRIGPSKPEEFLKLLRL
ncbi:MAG: threonylcarbamoyl-AMP synthase [Candidatus Yanofskybacteria bacterium RIFCSPHIGHO2_02_FULL_41_29]|uniref:L-threonylcarbamoyladenylate synthase n=1 Tax=Candidatus Yanofskybacteria bacterium RIFCSPHIGHO2_01_FULL_41_53 TaxID=1802663 RepID=A0A1F8EKZ0_9BACT|nr:MAG: threonylcarbamoyl-AMP synthase [Candidatus Yanofskybacteria bacterium RIFCSPHIGHO2_01_FULL_41_53]OGN10418.1 MAG: threonylcarbamoyl-AMP synthase [Candidatus Yanofskybacteria bacterium RIFCSPHIGHO2_02_FULL_41_29]OGN21161.1 MAG: threonylcarbamoyl-AMP synthase [Candidatus Yanofskybacteria bacterium RIFCSPLOWO2_01_FULL_41_67]OGN30065.1 MAG: threonylcarbamoyl-AMP synthase [Candidatus Yanofskybacteria bacterium RIFCSPLOWO2_02_FULL_41_13]